MGRRKISIAPITDDRNRAVTFVKRKNGLFKKGHELGVLCSAQVAVIVFNSAGRLFEFSSGDIDSILLRYSKYSSTTHERKGPNDYKTSTEGAKKGLGGKMTTMSDREEEEEEEEGDDDGVSDIDPSASKRASSARSSISSQKERSRSRAQEHSPPPPLIASIARPTPIQLQGLQDVPYPPPRHRAQPPPQQQHSQPQTFQNHPYMNGYPTNQYQEPLQPTNSQHYNYTNQSHPLANIPPQPIAGNWNYQQQGPGGGWGMQPNGYGGAPTEFGRETPYGGASGMENGGEMNSIEAAYVREHVIPQKIARTEGCFHQDNADDQYQQQQPQYVHEMDTRPLPIRTSTNSSIHSDDPQAYPGSKPRLSVSIPFEEGGRGISLREGADGKLFTAEPDGMDEGEESDPQTATSRFASDLLPSPSGFLNDICYSSYTMSSLNTAVPTNSADTRGSIFSWPKATFQESSTSSTLTKSTNSSIQGSTSPAEPLLDSSRESSPGRATSTPANSNFRNFRPAPMLSELEAPDVIRSLKRASTEGISPATFFAGEQERAIKASIGGEGRDGDRSIVVGDDGIEIDVNLLGGGSANKFTRKNRQKV